MVNDILVRTELTYRTDRVRHGLRDRREIARIRRGETPAATTRSSHPTA